MKELDIKERLDGLISKCLKQLLMVLGVKSLSTGILFGVNAANWGPAKSRLLPPFLFDAGEPQRHSPIESPQPIFDPKINDPRKFTLVIGDHGVTQC
jgi:hypothetical protein